MNWYKKAQNTTIGGQRNLFYSKEAEAKALDMGHTMGSWNAMHTCVCTKCKRTASIYDTGKGGLPGIFGSALRERCDGIPDRSANSMDLVSFHARRDRMREEAEKRASQLGHFVDAWTPLNSAVCRKCSSVVQLNNVYTLTDYPDHTGHAVEGPCRCNLETPESYKWEKFTNPNPKNALL